MGSMMIFRYKGEVYIACDKGSGNDQRAYSVAKKFDDGVIIGCTGAETLCNVIHYDCPAFDLSEADDFGEYLFKAWRLKLLSALTRHNAEKFEDGVPVIDGTIYIGYQARVFEIDRTKSLFEASPDQSYLVTGKGSDCFKYAYDSLVQLQSRNLFRKARFDFLKELLDLASSYNGDIIGRIEVVGR